MAERGRTAYTAYASTIDDQTAWEDLSTFSQNAWNAAAAAVEAAIDDEDEEDEEDDEGHDEAA